MEPEPPEAVTLARAARVWAKIGLLSFGGPAGQIALMHRELVERRRWIDEPRFLHALNYCMLLPGPEAQQLATYVGWLLHRTPGGLIAGGLFVLPGFLAILLLSILYATLRDVAIVTAVFYGLKAAVLAVVIEAVARIGKRALRTRALVGVAAAAFVAIFFFEVPFPIVVVAAAAIGFAGSILAPSHFPSSGHAGAAGEQAPSLVDAMEARGELSHTRPSLRRALVVVAVCLALWAAPLVALGAAFGTRSVFVEEGTFFSKAAMVTFGGAYAVLSYVAQRAVDDYGWLEPGEMLDGLGLAETTPGPLILVVQFVGFMGAFRDPHGLPPLAAGVLGSLVTIWVTFVPCFLWIFLGAPYVEALRSAHRLRAALAAVTAAVVGVVLNLSIWFAIHVAFGRVAEQHAGPLRLFVPELASLDPAAVALAAIATVALVKLDLGVPKTLAGCALLGAAWTLLRGSL